ncbi:hypothetical protein FB471_0395 [Amycolatopsis cihanbeyliensis]|uniref:Uncharacterized protein n=1 Tax=Amycolatopsis cihanbeyliensis TaxID=1128664 RepID=A0A542DCF0_AMYCI|nr:hypothetical protein FB471_0395 [Amycolatopsis cihanbeyliensis]
MSGFDSGRPQPDGLVRGAWYDDQDDQDVIHVNSGGGVAAVGSPRPRACG